MQFRHITKQLTRATRHYGLTQNRASWHRLQYNGYHKLQRHQFSSNLDNDKDNIVPSTSAKNEKLLSITNKFKVAVSENSSFWAWSACDKEHKDWIDQYNLELDKHKKGEIEMDTFQSFIKYIGSSAFDTIQRWRMRSLKRGFISYEEFMIGALHSFKSISSLKPADNMKISRCFTANLHDQITDIKQALFINDQYKIQNISPFGNSLTFYAENLPQNLDMLFTVRYYYQLQNNKDATDTVHKCADIEWKGSFDVKMNDNKQDAPEFELSDKGFLIHNVEVDDC